MQEVAAQKATPGDTGKNILTKASAGPDQELTPTALSVTFTPEEIEDLAELKKKLHELQDKMNAVDGKGGRSKKFETQIASLKGKIDDLSDTFSTVDEAPKAGYRPPPAGD
jgi:hypothetical protein